MRLYLKSERYKIEHIHLKFGIMIYFQGSPKIRSATTCDVDAMFRVRTSVQENALTIAELHQLGITPASIAEAIRNAPCAWVATVEGEVVGFAMVDLDDACLFAAFVLPQYEGCGIGTQLIARCETALFERHSTAWLETAVTSRAAGLYRHLGWGNETPIGGGDVRLEKRRATGAPSSRPTSGLTD